MTKKRFSCELALLIAIAINSLSVALLVKANFGISTLSSVPLVFSYIFTGLSFATWNFIFQAACLLALILITKNPNPAYLISFFISAIFAKLLDFYQILVSPLPDILFCRIIYFFAGFFIMGVGASLFIKCRLPVLPFDAFVRDLTAYLKKPVKMVKTPFDLLCVTLTISMSLLFLHKLVAVGIGTIFTAFLTGSLINVICKRFDAHFRFEPSTNIGKWILTFTEKNS